MAEPSLVGRFRAVLAVDRASRKGPSVYASDKVFALDAECSRLTAEVAKLKSEHAKQIADLAERFRAVNVARVIGQVGDDIVALRQRAERAEAALEAMKKSGGQ